MFAIKKGKAMARVGGPWHGSPNQESRASCLARQARRRSPGRNHPREAKRNGDANLSVDQRLCEESPEHVPLIDPFERDGTYFVEKVCPPYP